MLFDARGHRIIKPRFFGFGRTPASEPLPGGAPAADAIGFAAPNPEPDPDGEEGDDLEVIWGQENHK